jgi:hypothetical protein
MPGLSSVSRRGHQLAGARKSGQGIALAATFQNIKGLGKRDALEHPDEVDHVTRRAAVTTLKPFRDLIDLEGPTAVVVKRTKASWFLTDSGQRYVIANKIG